MRWILLLFWMLLCFAVAGISGSMTAREVPNWYGRLIRPSIAPPNWIFGPVWTLLYALMAIAAWRLSLLPPSPWRTKALVFFCLQLALNFAWSFIFFHWHRIGWALFEIVVLWVLILCTVLASMQVSIAATWLLAVYLAWVTFASVLNAAFWQLNRSTSP
jgi:translocator protein